MYAGWKIGNAKSIWPKWPKHYGCGNPHVWQYIASPNSDAFIDKPNLLDSAPSSTVFGKLSYKWSDVTFNTDIFIKFYGVSKEKPTFLMVFNTLILKRK